MKLWVFMAMSHQVEKCKSLRILQWEKLHLLLSCKWGIPSVCHWYQIVSSFWLEYPPQCEIKCLPLDKLLQDLTSGELGMVRQYFRNSCSTQLYISAQRTMNSLSIGNLLPCLSTFMDLCSELLLRPLTYSH